MSRFVAHRLKNAGRDIGAAWLSRDTEVLQRAPQTGGTTGTAGCSSASSPAPHCNVRPQPSPTTTAPGPKTAATAPKSEAIPHTVGGPQLPTSVDIGLRDMKVFSMHLHTKMHLFIYRNLTLYYRLNQTRTLHILFLVISLHVGGIHHLAAEVAGQDPRDDSDRTLMGLH